MYENLTIYILLPWTEIVYKQQMVFIVHDLKICVAGHLRASRGVKQYEFNFENTNTNYENL